MGGIGGPSLFTELQQEQDDLLASHSALECCPATGYFACQLAFLTRCASYISGPFRLRTSARLTELEAALAAERTRAAKQAAKRKRGRGEGGGAAGAAAAGAEAEEEAEGLAAAEAEAGAPAAGAGAAAVDTARAVKVEQLRATMRSAEQLAGQVAAVPQLAPVAPAELSAHCAQLAQLTTAARDMLFELIDAQRRPASNFIAVRSCRTTAHAAAWRASCW